jgi:hypothetical protein
VLRKPIKGVGPNVPNRPTCRLGQARDGTQSRSSASCHWARPTTAHEIAREAPAHWANLFLLIAFRVMVLGPAARGGWWHLVPVGSLVLHELRRAGPPDQMACASANWPVGGGVGSLFDGNDLLYRWPTEALRSCLALAPSISGCAPARHFYERFGFGCEGPAKPVPEDGLARALRPRVIPLPEATARAAVRFTLMLMSGGVHPSPRARVDASGRRSSG